MLLATPGMHWCASWHNTHTLMHVHTQWCHVSAYNQTSIVSIGMGPSTNLWHKVAIRCHRRIRYTSYRSGIGLHALANTQAETQATLSGLWDKMASARIFSVVIKNIRLHCAITLICARLQNGWSCKCSFVCLPLFRLLPLAQCISNIECVL